MKPLDESFEDAQFAALRNYAKVHPCLLGDRCCLKAALEALEP